MHLLKKIKKRFGLGAYTANEYICQNFDQFLFTVPV